MEGRGGGGSEETAVARYGALAEEFVAAREEGVRARLHAAVLAGTLALGAGAAAGTRAAALARVVVPVLRERYLRGVVASRSVHAAAGAPALALVAEAMQLADALCAVFGAAWTVAPAAAASPDQFCVLLVTLCATTVRTRAPSAAAVTACAGVLQHAVAFLACEDDDDDDDDDDDGDGGNEGEKEEESPWWTCLQAQTLLAVRARLLETLGDVCEALAEPDAAAAPSAPALARLLAEWLVLDAAPTHDSVAVRAVRCFGGSVPRVLALFRRTHRDTDMPPALYALLCTRVEQAAALVAASP